MTLGSLVTYLKLNTSNFTSQLGKAQAQMSKFAKNMSSSMAAATSSVKGLGGSYKDVSKIVQGIFVSKAIYGTMNAIQGCADAVWQFRNELEYAEMAYSNMFGSTELAKEFINVLEDAAAISPFQFGDIEGAAKRLKAYGIQTENLMYVTQGVMTAASAQGNANAIESISRAIGQIYTKGSLKAEEARQLAEAGIPVYEILADKLGLTQEQLGNLADQAIPASTAINALVDGINERFGGILNQSALTTSGLISNIVDNLKMIGSESFEPVFQGIRHILMDVNEALVSIRETLATGGIGGLFEKLVPPEMQESVRLLAANLLVLLRTIAHLGNTMKNVFVAALPTIVNFLNIFLSTLNAIFAPLAHMASILTNDASALKLLSSALAVCATMLVVWKAKAIAAFAAAGLAKVFHGLTTAVGALFKALTFLIAHPAWGFLALAGGLFLGISMYSDKARNSLNGMLKSLTNISGIKTDDLLLPSQKERANDLDKFNKKLDGTSDAMDDLADSTGKATKAAKGLLAFDEVFKLNEPDEGTDAGFEDITLPEFDMGTGGFDVGDWMPDESEFTLFGKDFAEKLMGALEEHLGGLDTVMATLLGGLLGAAIGKALGHKLLGGAIGALAAGLWAWIADELELTGEQKMKAAISTGIATVLGAAIGALFGGPAGAKIGAAIGAFVGSFWGMLSQKLGVTDEQKLGNVVNSVITGAFAGLGVFVKSVLKNVFPESVDDVFVGFAKTAGWSLKGALLKGLKAGVIGAVTSLGVGMLSDLLLGWLKEEFALTEQDIANSTVGETIGNIVGSVVGMILGGPLASVAGGALGQLAGTIVGAFWDEIKTTFQGTIIGAVSGLPVGALIGALTGVVAGPVGAAIGAGIGAALGTAIGAIVEHWDSIKAWFSDTAGALGEFFTQAGDTISGVWKDASDKWSSIKQVITEKGFVGTVASIWQGVRDSVGDAVKGALDVVNPYWETLKTSITETDFYQAVSTLWTDLKDGIVTIWTDLSNAVITVCEDLWGAVSTVWNDVKNAVSVVCEAVWGVVQSVWALVRDLIIKVAGEIWTAVSEKFEAIRSTITEIVTNVYSFLSEKFESIRTYITEKLTAVHDFVSQVFNKIKSTVTSIVQPIVTFITQKFTEIYNKIKEKLTQVQQFISDIFNKVYNVVKQYITNVYNTVKEKVTGTYTTIKDTFTKAYTTVKEKIGSMYDAAKSGVKNIYQTFKNWISDMWNNVFGKLFGWIDDGIKKLRDFLGLEKDASSKKSTTTKTTTTKTVTTGHATGGIFNREHIARFAEGNKAEAVIPLQNAGAMQPFVDAVADGLAQTLGPIVASIGNAGGGGTQQLQPLYVGTLIADERSLRELNRKMQVIQLQEERRR